MKRILFLLIPLLVCFSVHSQIQINQPYNFNKYLTSKDSINLFIAPSLGDSSNKVPTTAWVKSNIHGSYIGPTLQQVLQAGSTININDTIKYINQPYTGYANSFNLLLGKYSQFNIGDSSTNANVYSYTSNNGSSQSVAYYSNPWHSTPRVSFSIFSGFNYNYLMCYDTAGRSSFGIYPTGTGRNDSAASKYELRNALISPSFNYINLLPQSIATPSPATGNNLFDSSGINYRSSTGLTINLTKTLLTANRRDSFPDESGTFLLNNDTIGKWLGIGWLSTLNGKVNKADSGVNGGYYPYSTNPKNYIKNSDSTIYIPRSDSNQLVGYTTPTWVYNYIHPYTAGRGMTLNSNVFGLDTTLSYRWNSNVTASSAIARGMYWTPTLTAAANNDTLVGAYFKPSYSLGSYAGVRKYAVGIYGGLYIKDSLDFDYNANNPLFYLNCNAVKLTGGTSPSFFQVQYLNSDMFVLNKNGGVITGGLQATGSFNAGTANNGTAASIQGTVNNVSSDALRTYSFSTANSPTTTLGASSLSTGAKGSAILNVIGWHGLLNTFTVSSPANASVLVSVDTLGNTGINGNLTLGTAGNKLKIAAASNTITATTYAAGTVTLSGGTITVNTTAILTGSKVILTLQNCSNCGSIYLNGIINTTSFTINSTNALDGSLVYWEIR